MNLQFQTQFSAVQSPCKFSSHMQCIRLNQQQQKHSYFAETQKFQVFFLTSRDQNAMPTSAGVTILCILPSNLWPLNHLAISPEPFIKRCYTGGALTLDFCLPNLSMETPYCTCTGKKLNKCTR